MSNEENSNKVSPKPEQRSMQLTEQELAQINGGQIDPSAGGNGNLCYDGTDYGNGCGNGNGHDQ